MAKKTLELPERPTFEVEAVQYVKLTIPNGYSGYGGGLVDAVHTFTQEDAFALSNAVRDAAARL